tara:strand:+ start:276 stop:680 length:405 start_codon:yes stop_codon:yes gene_type:complete
MTTIEELTQRIALLEEQVISITKEIPDADSKKKKYSSKKDSSKKDSPKKERVKSTTGYLMYSNAHRDEVKALLIPGALEKPKNTEIMKELARKWKELSDDDKAIWNTKAKELNAKYKMEHNSIDIDSLELKMDA